MNRNGIVSIVCQSKEESETFETILEEKIEKLYEVECNKIRNSRMKIVNIINN